MRELGIVKPGETHSDMLFQYSTSSNVAQGCN